MQWIYPSRVDHRRDAKEKMFHVSEEPIWINPTNLGNFVKEIMHSKNALPFYSSYEMFYVLVVSKVALGNAQNIK